MFPKAFQQQTIAINGINLCVTTGGQGPALILLHGFPQTHLIWHRVAPALAQQFTLVMPDLRGYGNSAAPAGDAEHQCYSKREMARDIVALADHLGFEHFALAGHDRVLVNSLHSQGVDRLCEGAVIEATADDGLVEAFRIERSGIFTFGFWDEARREFVESTAQDVKVPSIWDAASFIGRRTAVCNVPVMSSQLNGRYAMPKCGANRVRTLMSEST